VQDFTRLHVWLRADALARSVYEAADRLPTDERFGLTRQMKRAATSIPSSIAEGAGRESPREFARFLAIASGSASELESQLLFAAAQGFLTSAVAARLRGECIAVRRMLASLRRRVTEN
jgi:four helix bundle protein